MDILPLIRHEWMNGCEFRDLQDREVLAKVEEAVLDAKRAREIPVVLLDLDSTLYEVGSRTLAILKEWADSEESSSYREARKRLSKLELRQVGYSVRDTFSAIGLSLSTNHSAFESARKYWGKRFFSSEYLKFDHAYPGAADFVQRVHQLGAEIIYLTGRDEPQMGVGTRANLVRDGFPWNSERTHLLLKPSPAENDLAHKVKAAEFVRKIGRLVASFENEPPNLVALSEIFPDAMHVFVETICSDHPAKPARGLYRVKKFHEVH